MSETKKMTNERPVYAFNRKIFCEGMRDGIPIALGYLAVSFSLGIAARNAGLTAFQGFLASLLNNASAGEYAAFTLIAANATYLEVAIITLISNARYLLMSCALTQRFAPGTPFFHRVGNAAGQLAQGVSGAGGDDQQIQQLFGADGLCLSDGGNDPPVTNSLHLPHQLMGGSKAGVGGGGTFGYNRDYRGETGFHLLQGLHGFGVGTEGAAHGKANRLVDHVTSSFPGCSSSWSI